MARRQKVRPDERTQTMAAVALLCRTFGHSMTMVETPTLERAQFRRVGQRLIMLRCDRTLGGDTCPYRRDLVVSLYDEEEVVSIKSWYEDGGKDYLVQERGTGRLLRGAARRALFARMD